MASSRPQATAYRAMELKPLIDAEPFTLAKVGMAHARLESGQALGKLVIDVAAE